MNIADPARLTPSQRLDEIAELLARGFQRLLVGECKPEGEEQIPQVRLAALRPVEAACGSHDLNPESTEPAA